MTSEPQSPHSDALREYYSSAPPDEIALDTLEFRHPAFRDDAGLPTAVRFVNDADPFSGTLEDDTPLNAGEAVEFTAGAFTITLPESSSPGLPTCQISVDNLGSDLVDPLMDAVEVPHAVEVTYRQWLASDPSAPGVTIDGMTIGKVNISAATVTAQAGFEDDLNVPFGREKYTREEYPGLVR